MKKSFISRIENGKEKFPKERIPLLLNSNKPWDVSMLDFDEVPTTSVSAKSGRDTKIGIHYPSPLLASAPIANDVQTELAVLKKQVELLEQQLKDKDDQIAFLKSLIK